MQKNPFIAVTSINLFSKVENKNRIFNEHTKLLLWYPIDQADHFHSPVLPVLKWGDLKQIKIESFGVKIFPLHFTCTKNIDPCMWPRRIQAGYPTGGWEMFKMRSHWKPNPIVLYCCDLRGQTSVKSDILLWLCRPLHKSYAITSTSTDTH